MTPPPEVEKEVEYCQFMQYIFSEEPYYTDYKLNSAVISFFMYHNDPPCNVFDETLSGFHDPLDMHGLVDRDWRKFTVRPFDSGIEGYAFGLAFESVNNNCIDLYLNCDSIENYSHI